MAFTIAAEFKVVWRMDQRAGIRAWRREYLETTRVIQDVFCCCKMYKQSWARNNTAATTWFQATKCWFVHCSMYIFDVPTPFRHWCLNMFCIFSCHCAVLYYTILYYVVKLLYPRGLQIVACPALVLTGWPHVHDFPWGWTFLRRQLQASIS